MAEDYDVDLVEVAPNAQPPVCRLMDYGKFRYQEQKKAQEMKARQKVIQVKEVKFRPATDENDYQTKLRALRRFLADGDKANSAVDVGTWRMLADVSDKANTYLIYAK